MSPARFRCAKQLCYLIRYRVIELVKIYNEYQKNMRDVVLDVGFDENASVILIVGYNVKFSQYESH